MSYRENAAPPADPTEVEIARIKEAEETVRRQLEQRFKERSERREQFWKFIGYDGTMVMIGIFLLGLVGAGVTISIMFAYARLLR